MIRARLYRAWARLRLPPLVRALDDLDRSQWLARPRLEALQLERLRAVLAHAGRTVPYYRELFAAHRFDPEGVRSPVDLGALPLLTREILVDRNEDLRSDEPGPDCVERATGGSTGRPLRFLSDRDDRILRSAHIYRGQRWLGWDLGERAAFVWGSDIDAREHRGPGGRLRDWCAGVRWFDAFTLSERDLDGVLESLARFGPCVVIGYPSSLHLLALRALETNRRVPLRGIETSAEMLAPRVRADLRRAFDCPVQDRYGCREVGVIAHECPEGGLHINAEAVVVESLEGEIVVTALNNRSMPLIRYRLEDLGAPIAAECPCGRGLPLLGPVRGRVSEVIRSPGGRLIHGEFFTHLFYGVDAVEQFQVRQEGRDRLEISIVSRRGLAESDRLRLEAAIREHGDAAFCVVFRRVDSIPAGPGGKFRFILADPKA